MKAHFWKGAFPIILAAISGPSGAAGEQANEIFSHSVLTLPFEYRSGEPWSRTITSREGWESFYNELVSQNVVDGYSEGLTTAPDIDFTNYQVVAGGVGRRNAGGLEVMVNRTYESSTYMNVYGYFVSAGSNCAVTQAVNYPYAAILIKKTDKPIRFQFSDLTYHCSD
ncbi:protease complex subunit PrcB family protein [Endothiovibrio diazotrophicus]